MRRLTQWTFECFFGLGTCFLGLSACAQIDAEEGDPGAFNQPGDGDMPGSGGLGSDGGTGSNGGSSFSDGGSVGSGSTSSGGGTSSDGGANGNGGTPSAGGAFSSGGSASGSGGSPSSGGAPGAGGSVSSGGSSGTGDECAIPALLETHFIPSGYMGDYDHVSDNSCDVARQGGAQGTCHRFVITAGGTVGWSGVAWQHPLNNWGDLPGCDFSAGATVTFLARGAAGGESVTFGASGIAETKSLTTGWVRFNLDLGASADSGDMPIGFSFSIANASSSTIYVDDLRLIE